MPPLVIPETFQVVVEGSCIAQPFTSVYHVHVDDPTPLESAGAAAVAALFNAYYNDLAPLRGVDWQVDQYTVTDIRTAGGPQFVIPISPIVGTGSTNMLPPDLAIVTTWLTNRRGGSFRGRTYHNGFTEEGMQDGRLIDTALGNEETAAQDFVDSFPGGLALAVASRTLLESNVVTAIRVNNVFDHQTRRRFAQ